MLAKIQCKLHLLNRHYWYLKSSRQFSAQHIIVFCHRNRLISLLVLWYTANGVDILIATQLVILVKTAFQPFTKQLLQTRMQEIILIGCWH